MLSGDMLAGWIWQLDVDGETIQGVVEDSVGLGTEDAVRGRFAHWFYTDPAARRYWEPTWAAAERIAASRIVTASLPDGIKVRQRDGWQWAFASDFGTAFQRWQDIKVPADATEQEAVAALLEWFASEQGQKKLVEGQQRAIRAAAERAKRKQEKQVAAETASGEDDEPPAAAHAQAAVVDPLDDTVLRDTGGRWEWTWRADIERDPSTAVWHPLIGALDEEDAKERLRKRLRSETRPTTQPEPPAADTTEDQGWGAKVAAMGDYDKMEDVPF